MTEKTGSYNENHIQSPIVPVRGQKVNLDSDLAAIFGVETKRLNEAVKRNIDRFPDDFAFRLNLPEIANLKSQFATSSLASDPSRSYPHSSHGGRRKLPKERQDVHESAIVSILQRFMDVIDPPASPRPPARKRIGFIVKEKAATYKARKMR